MEQPPDQVVEHPLAAVDHQHRRGALRDLRPPRRFLQAIRQPPLRPPPALLPRHRHQRAPRPGPPLHGFLDADEEPQIRGDRQIIGVAPQRLQHRHRALRHERPRRQNMAHLPPLRRAQLHLRPPARHRRQHRRGRARKGRPRAVVKPRQHPVPVHALQPQMQPGVGDPQTVEHMSGRRHAPIMPLAPDRTGRHRTADVRKTPARATRPSPESMGHATLLRSRYPRRSQVTLRFKYDRKPENPRSPFCVPNPDHENVDWSLSRT